MNPPKVYEVTSPNSHSTSKITKIVQSIVFLLSAPVGTSSAFVATIPIAASSLSIPLLPAQIRSTADADLGEVMKQPKHIQKPDHDSDHYDCIQDGLDRPLHWYEAVDQPKQDTHHHQNE